MPSTPAKNMADEWPNKNKVVAGVVPQSKVSQDPFLHADDDLEVEMES